MGADLRCRVGLSGHRVEYCVFRHRQPGPDRGHVHRDHEPYSVAFVIVIVIDHGLDLQIRSSVAPGADRLCLPVIFDDTPVILTPGRLVPILVIRQIRDGLHHFAVFHLIVNAAHIQFDRFLLPEDHIEMVQPLSGSISQFRRKERSGDLDLCLALAVSVRAACVGEGDRNAVIGFSECRQLPCSAVVRDQQVLLIPVGIIQGNTCDRDVKIVPCPMILINALVVLRILDVQLCLSVLPYLLRSDTHTSPEVNDLRCGAHNIDLDHMIFNLDAVQFGMQPDRKSGKIRLILLTEVYPERIQGIAAGIVAYI